MSVSVSSKLSNRSAVGPFGRATTGSLGCPRGGAVPEFRGDAVAGLMRGTLFFFHLMAIKITTQIL